MSYLVKLLLRLLRVIPIDDCIMFFRSVLHGDHPTGLLWSLYEGSAITHDSFHSLLLLLAVFLDLDLDIIYLAQFTNLHSLLSYKTYINCLGDPKMCP